MGTDVGGTPSHLDSSSAGGATRRSSSSSEALLIVDYRIEPEIGGGFRVVLRRGFGPMAVVVGLFLGGFFSLIAWFLGAVLIAGWQIARDAWTGAAVRKGPPLCCFPFIVVFFLCAMRPRVLGIGALVRQLRGRETGRVTNLAVLPPPAIGDPE